MNYGSLLTVTGKNKLAAAMQPGGPPLTITHIALGDGGGAAVVPSENRSSLINEVHRQTVDSIEPHPTDATTFLVQAIIPPTVGGFWIREIGLYDSNNDLVVYGNYPETAKPQLSEGAGNELVIRTYLAVSSTDAVMVQIDPSVVNATRTWVLAQLKWDKIEDKPATATRWPKWGEVTGKPTGFAPTAHTHPISDVTGLQTALAGKLDKTGGTLTGAINMPVYVGILATGNGRPEVRLKNTEGVTKAELFWDNIQNFVRLQVRAADSSNIAGWLQIKANGDVQASNGMIATQFKGNATSASKLIDAKFINGTVFDGTAAITTNKWGAQRTLKIGNKSRTVNGSADITWTLSDIGAAAKSHTHTSTEIVDVHRARRYFFNQL